MRGYLEALERGRHPATTRRWSARSPPRGIAENGAAAMRDLLVRDGVEFDAVFTLNDTLGLGVAAHAGARQGLRVPGRRRGDRASTTSTRHASRSRRCRRVDHRPRPRSPRSPSTSSIERINEKGDLAPPRQILADFRVAARESTGFGPGAGQPLASAVRSVDG